MFSMKRLPAVFLVASALLLAMPSASLADPGVTLSFFSGGLGAHADWLATSDQPPGDSDNQAIRLLTVNDAPTFSQGFAGVLFHHVAGIPAVAFPDSDFWVKTPDFAGPSLGSPRLVVEFVTAAGTPDGDAQLRPLALAPAWQHVSDTNLATSGWDVHSTTCAFVFNTTWAVAQTCHAGDFVQTVFIVADAYGINHRLDDITVDGKRFSSAADNGNGTNTPAGPTATTDPTLIPPLNLLLPNPQ
jgi:hypothetical protein